MAQDVWQQSLQDAVTSVEQLADYFNFDPRPLMAVEEKYPLRMRGASTGLWLIYCRKYLE